MAGAGRPQLNTVTYFPFFVEEGEKMFYIEKKYGNDGYATWIKILSTLAKTDYHYLNLSKISTLMYLSSKCNVDTDKFTDIVNDLALMGAFDLELWTENKVIWCQTFIDKIQEAYKKRSNDCIDYNNLLILLNDLGVRKLDLSSSEGCVNTQIKENKIKEDIITNSNNSGEFDFEEEKQEPVKKEKPVKVKKLVKEPEEPKIPSFEEFKDYALKNKPDVCVQALEFKFKSWIANGWKDGFNKPIKVWKSKILSTLPHLKTSSNTAQTTTTDTNGKKKANISL